MKTLISLSLALAFMGLANAQGGQGYGYGGAMIDSLAPQVCATTPTAGTPLDDAAAASLRFMREEEKLARDTYRHFEEKWGTRVFANVALSEQTHMDQVLSFLEAYGLADSATTVAGSFNDAGLQQFYDQLLAQGDASLLGALQASALIEETDIRDLRNAIAAAPDSGLARMYANLLSASYNHLRAFAGQIAVLGTDYAAQLLDNTDVAEILAGSGVAGLGSSATGLSSADLAVASGTCFTAQVQTATQSYGSGATIRNGAGLGITTRLEIETALRTQTADLLAVVEYTPAGGTTPMLLMRSGNAWTAWDGNRYSLAAAERVTLAAQIEFQVFSGDLSGLPGQYAISTGYRLDNGTLVFARDPIRFSVE
jgi:hypothetical protein